MQNWNDIQKETPPGNKDLLVLYSDGVISHTRFIKARRKGIIGWICDMFSQPSLGARPLMWRRQVLKENLKATEVA